MTIEFARRAVIAVAVVSLLGCAPFAEKPGASAVTVTTRDRVIVPGSRIGQVMLTGSISEATRLLGPQRNASPGLWPGSVMHHWAQSGLTIVSDTETGNILRISISEEADLSGPYARHETAEGLRLGVPEAQIVSVMGPAERIVEDANGKSLYYDQRGIRFLVARVEPMAGRVGNLRIVWRSAPPGDAVIVPGKRISGAEVGAPIGDVLALLGGGYQRRTGAPGFPPGLKLYYWPHLALAVLENAGRVIQVLAVRQIGSDGSGIRYATAEGAGNGSDASSVREIFGGPERLETHREPQRLLYGPNLESWAYAARGILFMLNHQRKVVLVIIFQPQASGR